MRQIQFRPSRVKIAVVVEIRIQGEHYGYKGRRKASALLPAER